MKTLIWIDDKRNPFENNWLSLSPLKEPFVTIWIKKYLDFVEWIERNGLPDGICFDHDLSDIENGVEKTGKDCANWLVNYCMDNDLDLPAFKAHSSNPAGNDNIMGLLNHYKRFREQEK